MAIQASDVRAAYATPIDFGAQIHQLEKEKEQKQLLEEERAQRQEDRDLKRVQTVTEMSKPFESAYDAPYGDMVHKDVSNYWMNEYPTYKKSNPNSSLSQDWLHANNYFSGLGEKMNRAKLINSDIDNALKEVAPIKGINAQRAAYELKKEAFNGNNLDRESIYKNVTDKLSDPEYLANYYDPTNAKEELGNLASGLGVNNQKGVKYGNQYFDIETPLGYNFDINQNRAIPNAEVANITTKKIVNGVPTEVKESVPLLPERTYMQLQDAGGLHWATAVHHKLNQLQKSDNPDVQRVLAGMDGQQKVLFAAHELASNLPVKPKISNVTAETLDKQAIEKRAKENFIYEQNKRQKEIPLLRDKIHGIFANDQTSIQNTGVGNYNKEANADGYEKSSATLVTADLNKEGLFYYGGTEPIQVYNDGGVVLKQPMRQGKNGKWVAKGVAIPVTDSKELYDLEEGIKNAAGKKTSFIEDNVSDKDMTNTQSNTPVYNPTDVVTGGANPSMQAMFANQNTGKKVNKNGR